MQTDRTELSRIWLKAIEAWPSIKKLAKDNASAWGELEFRETKIGRLDHKIEKLQILELVPGVEWLKTNADPTGTKVVGTLNNCGGGGLPGARS